MKTLSFTQVKIKTNPIKDYDVLLAWLKKNEKFLNDGLKAYVGFKLFNIDSKRHQENFVAQQKEKVYDFLCSPVQGVDNV